MKLKLDRTPSGTDSDPNTAPPNRFTVNSSETEQQEALAVVLTGTSMAIRPWVFVPELDRWMALSAAVVCNSDAITSLGVLPRGAKVFFQVTAITGATRFGIGVR